MEELVEEGAFPLNPLLQDLRLKVEAVCVEVHFQHPHSILLKWVSS